MSYETKTDYVWCQQCNKLVHPEEVAYTLQTVYKLHRDGIYPWGACRQHAGGEVGRGEVARERCVSVEASLRTGRG